MTLRKRLGPVLASALVLYACDSSTPRDAEPVQVPPSEAARPASEHGAKFRAHSGELLEISAASLPASGSVDLELALEVPSTSLDPLHVRIADASGRQIEAWATVREEDRMSASVGVEAGWLSPGTYLFELRTTEPSPLPIRRYLVRIR